MNLAASTRTLLPLPEGHVAEQRGSTDFRVQGEAWSFSVGEAEARRCPCSAEVVVLHSTVLGSRIRS